MLATIFYIILLLILFGIIGFIALVIFAFHDHLNNK
jgi:uncharacterized membrane protein YqjE